MTDAFVEGVRSVVQVCHLVILAPVALSVLAAQGRAQAVLGAVAGIVLGGWLFVSDRFGNITDTELRVTAAITIVLAGFLAAPSVLDRDRPGSPRPWESILRGPATAFILPAIIATTVAQWWRPCVGMELGAILTDAPTDAFGQLPASTGFMLGISVPIVVIGLLYAAVDASELAARRLAWVGAAGIAVLGTSVIAGQHGEIVARLFQWSR